jgi:anhydro-N-acetylmuramic acid kinase
MSTAAKPSNKTLLSIGLMSGTSMDGIDAALILTNGAEIVKELGETALSYDPAFKILLKSAEYSVRKCLGNMQEAATYYQQAIDDYLTHDLKIPAADIPQRIAQLQTYFNERKPKQPLSLAAVITHSTDLHALTVHQLLAKTGYSSRQIDVVGYHGQTLLHQPAKKISIIVGDGQRLANATAIPVVNDFRSRDIAAGGQGAPFAPLYHYALASRDRQIPVAVVNCGGIANITVINSANENDLIAFDTGPGNGLIDCLIRQRTQGKEQMDFNGHYGSQGRVHTEVLSALYAAAVSQNQQNYFAMPPPKSLDIGDLFLIPELEKLTMSDACATLEAFTADAIVNSLKWISADLPVNWILAGGGWYNPIIKQELQQRLRHYLKVTPQIQTADEAGWSSRALEAQIFAYLAVRSLQNQSLSLPGTTRVPYPLSGGKTYFPHLIN